MITTDQVAEHLATFGFQAPAFILQAAVNKVMAVEACLLGAGLSEDDVMLAQCYAAAIIAAGHSQRQIQSEHAPSGASRAFRYSDRGLRDVRQALRMLDTGNCLMPLLPPIGRTVMVVTQGAET